MTLLASTPDFSVVVDGKDITPRLKGRVAGSARQRLVSLTLTQKREEADQLEITIDDSDGAFDLPRLGATMTISLGWKPGSIGVTAGLVEKGSFTVDEASHEGTPDVIIVRGRSADFTKASTLRNRREQAWTGTTLGDVLSEIAKRQGLTPLVDAKLASIPLDAVHQSRESDAAMLRRLGREHDAVATIKAGKLIFARTGSGQSPSGKSLPGFTYQRRKGDRHSYQLKKREEVEGVTASYHDRDQAKKVKVSVGKEAGAKHLSRVYATKSNAKRAAEAAMSRAGRAPGTLSLTLALGEAGLYPEQRVTVQGFKPVIDATSWLAAGVTQSLQGDGFVTRIDLETAL